MFYSFFFVLFFLVWLGVKIQAIIYKGGIFIDFKRYLISMIVCIVTIFTIIFNMFVPVSASSDIPSDVVYGSLVNRVRSFGLEFSVSTIIGLDSTGKFSSEYSNFLTLCSQNHYDNYIYVAGLSNGVYSFQIWNFNTFSNGGVYGGFNYVYLRYDSNNKLASVSPAQCGSSLGVTNQISFLRQYCTCSYIYNGFSYGSIEPPVEVDNSFFGRLWDGLKNMWYGFGDDTLNFLFGDDSIIDYWDNIGNSWCDFVKTTLGITDDNTLNIVMNDIYNNDFSRDYWFNFDTKTINQIVNTSNNLKNFWSNNVTVVSDEDNNYHYDIKNYNSITNTYPSYLYDMDYFNNYICYNNDIDLSNIYNMLVAINNNIQVGFLNINTSLNSLVDINNIGFSNIMANFQALGGIIAGAIGVAWADIKSDLELIIDSINLDLGDIVIGKSGDTSDDDDNDTNNIELKGLDSLIDDVNVKIKSLFDDLKINLRDLFGDINVTINPDNNNPTEPTDPDYDPSQDDFWKQLKNIIIKKIPLFGQCVEILEPVTNTCIGYIDSVDLIEYTHQSLLLSEIYSFNMLALSDDDVQLDFDKTYDNTLFDGLVVVTTNTGGNVVSLSIPINNSFLGYQFENFEIPLYYYYNNLRLKFSNLLLFLCYLWFCWSVIHRTSKLFGHSSSDKGG